MYKVEQNKKVEVRTQKIEENKNINKNIEDNKERRKQNRIKQNIESRRE